MQKTMPEERSRSQQLGKSPSSHAGKNPRRNESAFTRRKKKRPPNCLTAISAGHSEPSRQVEIKKTHCLRKTRFRPSSLWGNEQHRYNKNRLLLLLLANSSPSALHALNCTVSDRHLAELDDLDCKLCIRSVRRATQGDFCACKAEWSYVDRVECRVVGVSI